MKELTNKDIKQITITKDYVQIETTDGRIGIEKFSNYKAFKNASKSDLENYSVSVYGIYWQNLDEDLSFSGFFKQKNSSDLAKVFAKLDQINISALARKVGISQPLMASYISGAKKPSLKRKKEIENHLHQLGKELQEIQL